MIPVCACDVVMEDNDDAMDINANQSNSSESNMSTSTFFREVNSFNKNIDYKILQETDEHTINEEWSATTTVLNSLNSRSSNSINIDALKEYCANPSDTLNDKDNFMVLESSFTSVSILNYDVDYTKYLPMCKPAFQKKHKLCVQNVSHVFENIIQNESQMEVTQNSIHLSSFQKRKRFLPPNDEDFSKIINIDNSGVDSSIGSTKYPKIYLSKKNKDQFNFDVLDYSLSTTDNTSVTDNVNVSKIKENTVFKKSLDSTNIMDEFKIESLTRRFTRKSTVVIDSVFDNINNSNTTSNCVSNNETTSLNYTYDIPINSNSTEISLLSKSAYNNIELENISIKQPMNGNYISENDLTSNMFKHLENAKDTLSNIYTIGNNLNETQPNKLTNKTIYTLADIRNINQSKSSWKPNLIYKLPLEVELQNYNIKVNDSNNLTIYDEIGKTENKKNFKSKLENNFYNGNLKLLDNIITCVQEKKISTSENTINEEIYNTLNISTVTLNRNVFNISTALKSTQNMEKLMDTIMTQQLNVQQDGVNIEINISKISLVHKFNKSNSFKCRSYKFNFSKKYGYHLSLRKQNYNMNLNANREKTNNFNVDFGSNSQISSKIQESNLTFYNGLLRKGLKRYKHSTSLTSTNMSLTLSNTTIGLFKNRTSIKQSKKSILKLSLISNTKDLSNISNNSLIQEINMNNVNRLNLSDSAALKIYNDGFQNKNMSTSIGVVKSSSININKSSSKKTLKDNKVILSKFSTNHMFSYSSTSSKNSSTFNNDSNRNESNNFVFFKMLSNNYTRKVNEFQTLTNNKLVIAEHTVNKIDIMSVHKQKVTHACAFKHKDPISGPLTRSFVKHNDCSPSISTKFLVRGKKTLELKTYLNSLSETITIHSQVENNVQVKFKSLYNKEPWITKSLYNFLVSKLTLKYNIYSIKYAEKFVKYLASVLKNVHTGKVDRQLCTDMLRYHMARYGIINDTSDYLRFLTYYVPKLYYDKLIPKWYLTTSEVKFNPTKYFIPIMEDEEFLNKILEYLNAA